MGDSRLRNGLRDRRVKAGLQQRELAERVGVSRQTLSSLESGETVPATSIALALAGALGCRVEELFWLTGAETRVDAGLGGGAAPGRGVAIALVEDRWVAPPLAGGLRVPADGVVTRRRRGVLRVR